MSQATRAAFAVCLCKLHARILGVNIRSQEIFTREEAIIEAGRLLEEGTIDQIDHSVLSEEISRSSIFYSDLSDDQLQSLLHLRSTWEEERALREARGEQVPLEEFHPHLRNYLDGMNRLLAGCYRYLTGKEPALPGPDEPQ